ncbi:MAG: enoyl-CoA hydratase/isomerase family protein [Alphaproteobacteria bacterium]|nr:enoyl-CoA hydratase/isomerase family protein [Alphaproteobacteria bacterium]
MVIDETVGAVRVLTLTRPERLNAIDMGARRQIVELLKSAGKDDAIRAVVLTGAGDRAFCAGQDLNESAALKPKDGPAWMATWRAYFAALSSFNKPLVAAINGVAAGGGFETALLCHVRLAQPAARLIMAEVDIGLPAIVGGFLLQAHLGVSRATEITLTGRTIHAEEARHMGLLSDIVPAADLRARAIEFGRALAAKPPNAMRLNLERFNALLRPGLAEAARASVRFQSEAVATGEPQKVMAEFLARRRAK